MFYYLKCAYSYNSCWPASYIWQKDQSLFICSGYKYSYSNNCFFPNEEKEFGASKEMFLTKKQGIMTETILQQ